MNEEEEEKLSSGSKSSNENESEDDSKESAPSQSDNEEEEEKKSTDSVVNEDGNSPTKTGKNELNKSGSGEDASPMSPGMGNFDMEELLSPKEKFDRKVTEYKNLIDSIHEQAAQNPGFKWQDPDFPPVLSSLVTDKEKVNEIHRDFKNYKWLRPNEIIKDGKFRINPITDCDMKAGPLTEGVFIGCIAMISSRNFTDKLFIDTENMSKGYVSFQFSQNGDWIYVVVDTLLPYDPDTKQLL